MSSVEMVYLECERARAGGDLISKVSDKDKEYHFQNWVQSRIQGCGLNFDEPGRNSYPDFRLVNYTDGYEVKGLAWPGREANYDSNSQVPMGRHNGREVYYVFGRYPSDTRGMTQYPVTDLVVCHGSFLNADTEYVHKNKSFRGFGSYGDVMVRDRKMYVVPTPFALTEGTVGLSTLIVPVSFRPSGHDLVLVGEMSRTEVEEIVVGYEFNLETNELTRQMAPNPSAGSVHQFAAYRTRGMGNDKQVTMKSALGSELAEEE